MLLKSRGLYCSIRCIWKPRTECSRGDVTQIIWAMVLGCPLDLFYFFSPHFFQKNISQKAFRENRGVHSDMLWKWICNFPPTTACGKFFERFPRLKSRKVVQNPRNCTQNERIFSPGNRSICCWASESLWALVSAGAQCLYHPWARLPLWNLPFLSIFHLSTSPFLFRPFRSSDLILMHLRRRSLIYFWDLGSVKVSGCTTPARTKFGWV